MLSTAGAAAFNGTQSLPTVTVKSGEYSEHMSMHVSMHMPIHMPMCISIRMSTHTPTCMAIRMSIDMSMCRPQKRPWRRTAPFEMADEAPPNANGGLTVAHTTQVFWDKAGGRGEWCRSVGRTQCHACTQAKLLPQKDMSIHMSMCMSIHMSVHMAMCICTHIYTHA